MFGKNTTVDNGKSGTVPEKLLRLHTSLRSREVRSIINQSGLPVKATFSIAYPASYVVFALTSELVKSGDEALGRLTIVWCDGRSEINRDEELALELVADAVGDRAAKLLARAEADPQRVVAMRR